ncbi:hypothetical protein MLD38_035546 [Melastoma candidum]|uniref:Uncharacterized protein n=1 Tax=Melastoma candidum TaxID=119954 RepID=A0ACB9LGF6_9MYRT|nr:hypothetical protein MLD38_035546 [Melastoma candidum]
MHSEALTLAGLQVYISGTDVNVGSSGSKVSSTKTLLLELICLRESRISTKDGSQRVIQIRQELSAEPEKTLQIDFLTRLIEHHWWGSWESFEQVPLLFHAAYTVLPEKVKVVPPVVSFSAGLWNMRLFCEFGDEIPSSIDGLNDMDVDINEAVEDCDTALHLACPYGPLASLCAGWLNVYHLLNWYTGWCDLILYVLI